MKDIALADIRTFVLLGHTGSGKTSLVDSLLFKLGINDRLGSVAAKSSMADYTDEEKERQITIHAKPFSAVYKRTSGTKAGFVFIDTPGYADFFGQVIMSARVVESALIAIDAVAGLQVGTGRAWKQCEDMGLPRGIVITGLDRENADCAKVIDDIRAAWGPQCVPVVLPLAAGGGVAELLSGGAGKQTVGDAEAAYGSMVELAAETNDSLLEKYLGGEVLSQDEVAAGLRKSFLSRKFVPVFACAAIKDVGVTELLEGLLALFPSPADRPMVDAKGAPVDPKGPFSGFVWRTVNDPFVGQLTFLRIASGSIAAGAEVLNTANGEKERLSSILDVNGKKQAPVEQAGAGEIVALTKLKHTSLGQALGAAGSAVQFAPFSFPKPVIWCAVRGKTQGDEDKIGGALGRLGEEDPTLRVERDKDTHETILSGLGDVHLDVAVDRMKRRSNVEVVLSTPKVPYKETVTTLGEGHYKHKKQTGGRGQYGEVYLRVQPLKAGDEEWFEDAVVGGVIPGNFMPAVQKGVLEGTSKGAVAGCPVINVKVSIYDGSYHDVDSSEIAFKIAGSRAFRDGMSKARAVLLEPIMDVKILVPEHFMGDVTGDMSHRRGRILGMGSENGLQVITAEVPQAEMFRYSAELRSMTGGRGTFEMSFSRYEVVPSNVAQKIIAEAEKTKEEEE